MLIGNLPNIVSDGKININNKLPNFPEELNYNINPIQYSKCECCNVISINQLNRPPLSLLKINYNLNLKI
jgi:hypothetical protein